MKTALAAIALMLATAATAQDHPTRPDFKPMDDVNKVVDLTLDSLEKAATARPVAGSSRKGTNPVLFLVGNSTM